MDRRNALASLSSVAVASILFTTGRATSAQSAVPSPGKTLSAGGYKVQTLISGTTAKQTSQLALTQASHPKVKEFAQFEIDEQTTVAQVLTGLPNPPPAPLDAEHQAMVQKLQSMSGKAFDVAYLQGQVQGHQELLAIQQGFLDSGPKDLDKLHVAMLARTTIQMHLSMLADLQREIAA